MYPAKEERQAYWRSSAARSGDNPRQVSLPFPGMLLTPGLRPGTLGQGP